MVGFKSGRLWLFLQKGGIALALVTFVVTAMFFLMAAIVGNELAVRFIGAEAIGTVTEHSFEMSSCSSGRRHSRSQRSCPIYHVGYAYVVDDHSYAGRQQVDEDYFLSTSLGKSTPVRYMTFMPEWSLLAQSHHNFLLFLIAPILGLIAVHLAKLCRYRFHRVGEMIRLRDHGLRRMAQVVSVNRTSLRVNRVAYHYMVWTDEAWNSGESLWQSASLLPQVGSTITVFTDPKGEIPSVWDKDCGG